MAELRDQLAAHVSPTPLLDAEDVRTQRLSAPTAAELASEVVAPGEPALLPWGVIYQADWRRMHDGMARHARAAARALSEAGVPVRLSTISDENMPLDDEAGVEVWRDAGHLARTTISSAPVAIRHLVIHNPDILKAIICPAGARLAGFEAERKVYESTIVYTSWERSTVSESIVKLLNRCAETWVPCEANVKAFHEAGVKRVRLIPFPYDPNDGFRIERITRPDVEDDDWKLWLSEGRKMRTTSRVVYEKTWWLSEPRGEDVRMPQGRRFYNIGKWEPRKNQHALLGAFLTAFSPKEKASLYIKTSSWGKWDGYPTPQESVAAWLSEGAVRDKGWTEETFGRRVWIVDKRFRDDQIVEIHKRNNIYVSAAHSEGWDLPAFDARCAGNRLVYTPYGGPEDFAGAEDVRVPYEMVPVHPGYRWEPEAKWGSYGVEALADALRRAQPAKSRVHPPDFYVRFGSAHVGARMGVAIGEVLSRLGVEVGWKEGFG